MRKNFLMVGAAILGAGSILAADVEVKANADTSKPKVEAEVKRDGDRSKVDYKQEARIESSVKPVNKAHSLLGMEVRNREGEKLGEVKDIVLDLGTGKVSYIAIAAGGFLGLREKLIAVPANAVAPSETGAVLVMDASRGEIVDAPGFAATNWPDHRNANFDAEPFWRPKHRGAAATTEVGRAKLYTDADPKDREVRVEADTNRSRTIVGQVKAIDKAALIIDVNGRSETYSFDGARVRSSEYKVGDRVSIKYHSDNGKMIIDDLARP